MYTSHRLSLKTLYLGKVSGTKPCQLGRFADTVIIKQQFMPPWSNIHSPEIGALIRVVYWSGEAQAGTKRRFEFLELSFRQYYKPTICDWKSPGIVIDGLEV